MSCATPLQLRPVHVPSTVRLDSGGRQQSLFYKGLLGRAKLSKWRPSTSALVSCFGTPTRQQRTHSDHIAVKPGWRGAPLSNTGRLCTRASSMPSNAESTFTMFEYDYPGGFGFDIDATDFGPTSKLSARIEGEVPPRVCSLYKNEDILGSLGRPLTQTEAGGVVVTPWTAVVKSPHNFPEAAFLEAVIGEDGPVLHLLEYTYVSDVLEKRGPYREAHLKLAAERCIMGGPKGDPIDGALLLFGTDKSVVEDFVSQDPYIAGGLVTTHRIRPLIIEGCDLEFFKGDSAVIVAQGSEKGVDVTALFSHISSMSGFSKVDGKHKRRTWSWEAKSVNGRSLDVRARVPNTYSSLEQAAFAAAAERFARGSVSCFLEIKVDKEQQDRRLVIDEDAMLQARDSLQRLSKRETLTTGDFDYGHLLQIPGVVRWEEPEESEEEREDFLQKLTDSLQDALDQLLVSRAAEGDRLRAVLSRQVAELEALVEQAAITAQDRLPHLKEKMQKQMGELLEMSRALDPGRLEQEVALLTTRLDVREEIDRLRSHIVAAKELLSGHHKQATSPKKGNKGEDGNERPLSIGRQLDFLCQEFTRECSTICSKSNDVPLTQVAMQMRGVSEQIKEQAANIQ